MVLDRTLHKEFIKIYPLKRKYIWQCSTINFKLKVSMWCLTHNLSFITNVFCILRDFIKGENEKE